MQLRGLDEFLEGISTAKFWLIDLPGLFGFIDLTVGELAVFCGSVGAVLVAVGWFLPRGLSVVLWQSFPQTYPKYVSTFSRPSILCCWRANRAQRVRQCYETSFFIAMLCRFFYV